MCKHLAPSRVPGLSSRQRKETTHHLRVPNAGPPTSYHVPMRRPVAANTAPAITSWGATRSVTGSMHLLQSEKQRILLDCGLFLEKGAQLRNREFPFDPCEIDAVLLTHAHLDHCGNLPTLVKQGFRGPIYCTAATRDLLLPMLEDAANIQSIETQYFNNRRAEDEPWLAPLYLQDDVHDMLQHVRSIDYDKPQQLAGDVSFQFRDAGHVLGSASIHLRLSAGAAERTLTYTGDIGRNGVPLFGPVAPYLPSELILSEATYGGQTHEPYEHMLDHLADIVERTIDRGGKVLIPAFSLGRVQLIVYSLMLLIAHKRLDRLPIIVDSPLSNKILDVVQQHTHLLAPSVRKALPKGKKFLHASYIHYITSVEESKDAMLDDEPGIVIASSGMAEGGRIVHYLKRHIDDPRCSVILVSYQSSGSLGWRLMQPGPTVFFAGREWNKWADVQQLRGFSGHADQSELINQLSPVISAGARVHLVHGEEPAMLALQSALNSIHEGSTHLAERGETTRIGPT